MTPHLGLVAPSYLATFLLRSSAEWLLALLLVRILSSARLRFAVWLGTLLGIAVQWLWILAAIARSAAALQLPGLPQSNTASASLLQRDVAVPVAVASYLAWALTAGFGIYTAGVLWRSITALVVRSRLAQALRHRRAPGSFLAEQFALVLPPHHLQCELWILPGIASPATLGWLRPRIFVPPVCEAQNSAEIAAIFWHELKHIDRRDALWNAIARLCRTLLWFHPAAHHAMRQLIAERELACDSAVVHDHPESRDLYASCLVRFARIAELSTAPALPALQMASRTSPLSTRVRTILAETSRPTLLSRIVRVTASVLLTAAAASVLPAIGLAFHAIAAIAPTPQAAETQRTIAEFEPPTRRPRNLSAPTGLSTPISSPPVVSAQAAISPHDEALAAQHRAAMDVLTQSTGMEANSDMAGLPGTLTPSREPSATGSPASSTVASIAIDAAEHIGPLLTGRDADNRR